MGAEEKSLEPRIPNAGKKAGSGYRLIFWIVAALIAASVIGGAAYLTQSPEQKTVSIGAGPFRTDAYELMREVADVVERNSDWLRIEVVASRDSSENISLLNSGKIDAATIRSDTPVAKDMRLIASLFPDYFQILVRADRSIFQVTNLVGKKVAIPIFGTDEFRSFWAISDHYDIPIDGVQWLAMDFQSATDKLLAGEVDAVFTVRSLRDRLLLNLFGDAELKKQSIRFIPINQAHAISLKRPFLKVGEVPVGSFIGKGPTPIATTRTVTVDRLLVTRENLDPAVVRELTRILFEHRYDLTIRFALASAIRKPDLGSGTSVPVHEGALQYYTRDEPSFIQENAEPLALLVALIALLFSMMLALRTYWLSKQKNRMDAYNYALLHIAEVARDAEDLHALAELKAEMFSVLETVVTALDTDEISNKGFQSFSLLWESVHDILKDRTVELQGDQVKANPKSSRKKRQTAKQGTG